MAEDSLIDVGYTLVLYLKQSIFSNATIVKIPIYIGTIPIHYVKDEEMNNLFNIQTYKGNGPFYPFYNFTN
jgi:hypothetical protein